MFGCDFIKRSGVIGSLFVLAACQHHASPRPADSPSQPAADAASFVSVQGDPYLWPSTDSRKATVFIFMSSTCPIANGYAPEIKRLSADYEPSGIAICLVHTEPDLTLEAAQAHARDYGYTCPVVLDPHRRLVRIAGAKVTPEAAVFSPTGVLLYRGRIDDRFPDIGVKRAEPRTTELRDALDSILAGKPVAVSRTKAVGCYIE